MITKIPDMSRKSRRQQESEQREMIELLLDEGADANAKDHGGKTPFDWAEARGNSEAVSVLRKKS